MKNKFTFILAIFAIALAVIIAPVSLLSPASGEIEVREYGVDLAFGRRVVSTGNTDDNINVHAVDANPSTRYASQQTDDAFFYVDLGSKEKIGKIVLDWEAAYAAEYKIMLSNDAINWTTAATVQNNVRTKDEIVLPVFVEAQFVRFQGVRRATSYGYSFYSFEVYGAKNLAVGGTVTEVSGNEHPTDHQKEGMLDNLANTRWASPSADNQYFIVDLGADKTFDLVKIRWEVSFARRFALYYLDASPETAPARDDERWTQMYKEDAGLGEVDTLRLDKLITARYIKAELIQRETSENTKKTGRYPYQSSFSIYSFELYNWDAIHSVPLGSALEFSKNSPAWTAMSNITLNNTGLILAPIGYPQDADGEVTNLDSIKDGDIPGFESYAVYNPAVIYDDERGMFHMIYRAELPDNFGTYFGSKYELGHMSTLAYAYSYDGVNYTRGADNPIAWPTTGDERGGGLEDPRVCRVKNDPNRGGLTTYYITYTMYDNSVTREGVIYTHDFVTFHKQGRLAPDYNAFGGAIKSGSYVSDPEGNAVLINDPRPGKTGKVYVIYMKDGSYTRVGFTKDVLTIQAEDIVDIDTAGFGNNSIEKLTKNNESCMALTNIYGEDDEDIYLMYGGGSLSKYFDGYNRPNVNGWFYALGVIKTTKSNPFELTNVRLDLDEPTLHPTDTNKIDYGLFNKCMFADTMLRKDNKWYFYYGAGDMYIGLATARGDFGAGAASYTLGEDGSLTAYTSALNKKYDGGKTVWDVEFVAEIYGLDGNKLGEQVEEYGVEHFSHSEKGIYSNGEYVSVTVNTDGLPEQYYVVSYLRDKTTGEILNNLSAYTKLDAQTVSTGK